MDNTAYSNHSLFSAIFFSSLMVLAFSFFNPAQAKATNQIQVQKADNQIQLAHRGRHRHHRHRHHRRHWRGGVWWVGPGYYYPRRVYWTGWRVYYRHGRRCVRKCLVSRRTGRVIRCKRRCYY